MAKRKNKNTEQIDPATLDTYFKKRMYALGITDTAAHCFKVAGEFPSPDYSVPIFAEDIRTGNIEINYPCLWGGAEVIPNTETPFIRTRLHPDHESVDGEGKKIKYRQEPKSGVHIFHPPAIIKKFTDKTPIETLFVVEGEFKAYAGALAGLDIVGLGGKDLFTDGEKQLHGDLLKIIQTCDVVNLVLLLDADVEQVTWDPEEEPHKDLAKRLYSFYNTVIRFRELAKGVVKDAYFSHIKEDYLEESKGLDDLLQVKREKEPAAVKKVCEDLLKLTGSRVWFDCINLSTQTPTKIKGIFRLNMNKGVPQAFYFWYEGLIKDQEFTFSGGRYRKSKNGESVELVRHEDSFKFIRVGCDYIKIIHVPDAKGILRRKLKGWKSGEITRDYVNTGHKNFYETLEKYDEFCNVPNNTPSYQPVIAGCYNMYYKLEHELQEGQWPVIEGYLKHVFGETKLPSDHTMYELALDYLTILYRNPTQKLPIICLVSRERGTGKSTFLWLLKALFQDNTTFIGNDDIKDQFNDDWAAKLVIGIDEGFIDKKNVLEKLKSMSTAPSIKLRGMYQGRQEIPFFGKFALTSNDEDNFIAIDDKETRFLVQKVPILKNDDPDILQKMEEEVPAFLHYLAGREILHPKRSRHWFAPELLVTEALNNVRKNSKGWAHSEISVIMEAKFIHYRWPTLYYTLEELSALINKPGAAVKYRDADIKRQLNDKFGLYAKMSRADHPKDPEDRNGLGDTIRKQGRLYEFRVENFFTEAELRGELSEYFNYDQIILDRQSAKPVKDEEKMPF
ncbi:MAG: primase-helicase family protein [Mucilaginibacter sp.]